MLEKLFIEAIQQVPALGVLTYLVIAFIKAQHKTAEMFTERMAAISAECHEVTVEASAAIKENTVIHGRVLEALDRR